MKHTVLSLLAIAGLLLAALPALAQEDTPRPVTDDEILDVAERMYCPVCENEPLNECRNNTCMEWKEEIGRLLSEGYTEEEIMTYFVDRYGQHVVGVPLDPLLRVLSFVAPILGSVIALGFGLYIFRRWQNHTPETLSEGAPLTTSVPQDNDPYRSQLEQDLGA